MSGVATGWRCIFWTMKPTFGGRKATNFQNMLWKHVARIKNVLYNRDARHKSVSFFHLSDNSGDRRSLTLLS
jgi:hypothetical protein